MVNKCFLTLGRFSPKKSSNIKYGANVKGGFTPSSFAPYKLPTSIVGALVTASNHSLALNTWATYKTAENHLSKCEKDTGVKFRFPMTD